MKCHFCGKDAVVLCDYITKRAGLTVLADCSRALCPDHRRKVGHICDRSRRTTNNNSDTIDFCPEHHLDASVAGRVAAPMEDRP